MIQVIYEIACNLLISPKINMTKIIPSEYW